MDVEHETNATTMETSVKEIDESQVDRVRKALQPLNERRQNVEPLRPLAKPLASDDSSQLNDPPVHEFKLVTNDVFSMSSLMYAMRDLVGDVRLYADENGVILSERVANNSIFVYLDMKKDVFEQYSCKGDIVLCFEPKRMYSCISRHQTDSLMTWRLMKEPPRRTKTHLDMPPKDRDIHYYLEVTIMSTAGAQSVYTYYIPLLRSFKQIYKAKRTKVAYFLAMDTNVLVNDILSTFASLRDDIASKYVEIECAKDFIEFRMVGNAASTVSNASFRIKTLQSEGPPPNKRMRRQKKEPELSRVDKDDCQRDYDPPDSVVAKFCLIYLLRLQKCFSINRGYFYMYIQDKYPLVFKSRLRLGDLYAAVMFVDESDGNEGLQQREVPDVSIPISG